MPTLTTSGSPTANGDSTVTINSTGSDRVQAPVALTDETQGWFAARIVNPTVEAGILKHVFTFGDDASNLIRFYKGETAQGGRWRLARLSGGAGGEADVTNGTTGADMTVIGRWTATVVGISQNGVVFTDFAATSIPTLAATTFDIGQRAAANHLGTAMYWCAAGTGTLTNANAATLNDFGDTDPTWAALPGTPTFLWTCDNFTYLDSAPVGGGGTSRVIVASSGSRW